MTKIAPSILSADFSRLGEEVRRLEANGADWVHVDVMDGVFVPNITIGPGVVGALRPHTRLPFDVHLMIMEPERYIDEFARAGADIILLDNMSPSEALACREAIKRIDRRIVVEASGGITPQTAPDYAAAVDVISLGWLTHSVRAADLSLDITAVRD